MADRSKAVFTSGTCKYHCSLLKRETAIKRILVLDVQIENKKKLIYLHYVAETQAFETRSSF
jgi:hypothetical protein